MTELNRIPVIDLAPFVENDRSKQGAVAREIYHACHHIGFMGLQNYGLPTTLVERVFHQSRALFALPLAEKKALAYDGTLINRGYMGIERERLDPEHPGDLKESFNVGLDRDDATSPDAANAALTKNRWIPGDTLFRSTMLEFFDACTAMADRVFWAISLALELPEEFMAAHHQKQEHLLRLLHYPPLQGTPRPGQVRAGEHFDYGSITLLFQDDQGGLEVQTADGDWIEAPCLPNTVLVNTGDLMQRWTNDIFRSTRHRVGTPTGDRACHSRYSIAFFCQPDHDAAITCIDSCQTITTPPKYPSVLAGEHLVSLLQATY